MFQTTYVVKLSNPKYLNHLIKYHIYFKKIKYQKDLCFLYVDEENFKKLEHFWKVYDLELSKVLGKNKYILLFRQYYVFIISLILGIGLLYLLSNIIFDVRIMSNNKELVKIIDNELKNYDLKKYRFVKSFNEKEIIRNNILKEYKDKFEWLEIERIGCIYYVNVLERIINKNEDNNTFYDVVAKKNAVIKEIKASNGQIIKKVNDYVNKGDIIVSGRIYKNDEVKNIVNAKGTIYGETWYTVKVEIPYTYEEDKNTSSYKKLSINWFNKKIFLFGKGKASNAEYIDKPIISSNLLPISFNITTVNNLSKSKYFYTYIQAENKGIMLARERLIDSLSSDSEILMQKKLKLYEENSKIIVEVFFKVYEDITDYKKIIEGEIDGNNN